MSFKTYLDWNPAEFDKHRDILGPKRTEPKTIPEWIKEEIYDYEIEDDLKNHAYWKVVDPQNYRGHTGQRLVLYNNKVYTYTKETVHDVILIWMILNAGANISESMYENWNDKPLNTNFFCLHQQSYDDIYFSESYNVMDENLSIHADNFYDMFKKLESSGYNIINEATDEDYNYN